MRLIQVFLLLILCFSCSYEPEFYSAKPFKATFTNELFLSKLVKNKIPYQIESYMGEDYISVHSSFKNDTLKLRADSLKEGQSLVLINLDNECSQLNLAQRFKESAIYHQTVTKAGIPSVRMTQIDKNSEKVANIFDEYEWRCP